MRGVKNESVVVENVSVLHLSIAISFEVLYVRPKLLCCVM